MTGSERAGVTPAGIRDGRPEVLRGLVAARGSAVLAYCRAICPPEDAGRAAAEAFARFRAAVVDAPDVTAIDPDALLLGATRHAAASLARTSRAAGRSSRKDDTCAAVPGLLAARAAGVLGAEEAERLDGHLERCPACRGLAEDFDRAEEAYRTATSVPVPVATERMVLAALTAAAPVHDADPGAGEAEDAAPAEAPEASYEALGPAPPDPDETLEPAPLDPEDPAAAEPEPEPTAAWPEDEDEVLAEDLPAHTAQEVAAGDVHAADGLHDDELEEHPHDPFYDGPLHPDDEDEEPGHEHHDLHEDPDDTTEAQPGGLRVPHVSLPSLPRPRVPHRRAASADGEPGRQRDLRPVLLPGLVVLAAVVVFLAASGVFGGDDPEPPRAERQRPELRVERPVTTPLPVEPVVEQPPPVTTTTPGATTTPVTPPADGTETTPPAVETTPGTETQPDAGDGTTAPAVP